MQPRPITAADAGSTSGTGPGGQTVVSGTPTVGSTVPVLCAKSSPAPPGVLVVTGTFVATLVVEVSSNGGVTWNQVVMTPVGETAAVTTITVPGTVTFPIDGITNARARCTAYTSGTALVALKPGYALPLPVQTRLSVTPGITQNLLIWGEIPGATGYNVYSGATPGSETLLAGNQAGPTYTDGSLTANSAHSYYVTVVNANGESLPSNEVTGVVLPSAPTSLGATGSASQIALAWTAPAGGAVSYNIYRGLSAGNEYPIHIANTTGVSYNDTTDLVYGTTYFYVVRAINAGGRSVVSNEVSATATGQAAPTSLAISASGSGSLSLTWVAAAGATTYNLYRGLSAGNQATAPVATGLTGTTFTDTGLTNGTTYYYKMTAVSSVGQSVKSNEASAAAGGVAPATPANLAAFGGVGGAYVQWSASAGALTYDLQSSPDGTTWTDLSLAQGGTSFADPTGHANYRVRATSLGGNSAYQANPGAAAGPPLANSLAWLRGVIGFTVGMWSTQDGTGNNATQATGGRQMAAAAGVLGGKAVVRSADAGRSMNFANILPLAASFTLGVLYKLSDQTGPNHAFCGNAAADTAVYVVLDGTAPDKPAYGIWHPGGTAVNQLVSTAGQGNPQTNWVLAFVTVMENPSPNSGGPVYNAAWYLNNVCGGISKTFDALNPGSATLTFGGPQNNPVLGFVGDCAEVFVTGSVPTAAAINNTINMVNATYGLTLTPFAKQVLFVGDSITAGGKATTGGGSFASLLSASSVNRYYVNTGEPTGTTANIISVLASRLYPYTSCGVATTCVIMLGTNDLSTSVAGTTIWANIQTIIAGLRANGASKVVLFTCLPCGGGAVETQRQVVNNAIRASGTSVADAIADVETISMGAAGANTNTTWYNADTIHPNDTGHANLETLLATVIGPIW